MTAAIPLLQVLFISFLLMIGMIARMDPSPSSSRLPRDFQSWKKQEMNLPELLSMDLVENTRFLDRRPVETRVTINTEAVATASANRRPPNDEIL